MEYKIKFKVLDYKMHRSCTTLEESRMLAKHISLKLNEPVKVTTRVDAANRYQVIEMWYNGKKKKTLKGANL